MAQCPLPIRPWYETTIAETQWAEAAVQRRGAGLRLAGESVAPSGGLWAGRDTALGPEVDLAAG